MRIIAGEFSGRRIITPDGRATRPTSDRTRESLFNILSHRDGFSWPEARVLDLFSGSGALGFEAMSRGAAWCLFVETDTAARAVIRSNIETFGLFGATRLHRRSATDLGLLPASAAPHYTLAFLDPPYGKDLAPRAMASMAGGEWLAPDALVVIEQGADEKPAEHDHYTEISRRPYGAAQIGVYQFNLTG